jgi:hypothetical protein
MYDMLIDRHWSYSMVLPFGAEGHRLHQIRSALRLMFMTFRKDAFMRMQRRYAVVSQRLSIVALALLVLTCVASVALGQARKPNILVIFGDDIGIPQISAYSLGLMGYRTPNIDRIAKEGMVEHDGMVGELL